MPQNQCTLHSTVNSWAVPFSRTANCQHAAIFVQKRFRQSKPVKYILCFFVAPSPFPGPILVPPEPHTHCGVATGGLRLCGCRRARNKKSSLSKFITAATKPSGTSAVRHIWSNDVVIRIRRCGFAARGRSGGRMQKQIRKKSGQQKNGHHR